MFEEISPRSRRVKMMLIMAYSVDGAIICEGLQYGAAMHHLHYGTTQG
jgi:hypothetical protein